ncbi:MAG: FkbM family methyltransferase [Ruminococcus sp.]|nr:FkbM family methyltransferase [Ruminococcus sp.]
MENFTKNTKTPGIISDIPSVFGIIKNSPLKRFIYGMGNGADKLIALLARYEIPFDGIVASDEFVRGHSFHGIIVRKISDVEREFGKVCLILAFGTNRIDVIDRLYKLKKTHELIVPDLPLYGNDEFSLEKANESRALFDDTALFDSLINFKLSGDIEFLKSGYSDYCEIFKAAHPKPGAHFIDIGAYRGDTVKLFTEIVPDFGEITAFEPDFKTFKKLEAAFGETPKINLYNAAVWNRDTELLFDTAGNRNSNVFTENGKSTVKALCLDNLTSDARNLIIKIDAEGAEKEVIEGAQNLIKNGAAVICAVYHRANDLFELPLLLKNLNSDYKFKLMRTNNIPGWDAFVVAEDRQ